MSTIFSTLFAADYPFLDVLWTMLIFFLWVMWFWLLIVIIGDVFRRHDIGGGKKTIWLIFILFVPFIGVLAYVLANSDGMAERNMERARSQRAQMDDYVRETAGSGGAAAEIDKAKQLLDSGAISQAEFDAIKAKALA
ncbi:MAG TPA: PLDc N-terminal domain-containing protein [Gaiellaceae bacterium]|nr:PLDc N-terminal domain-containing protein [Gaiellaceae bacterium]